MTSISKITHIHIYLSINQITAKMTLPPIKNRWIVADLFTCNQMKIEEEPFEPFVYILHKASPGSTAHYVWQIGESTLEFATENIKAHGSGFKTSEQKLELKYSDPDPFSFYYLCPFREWHQLKICWSWRTFQGLWSKIKNFWIWPNRCCISLEDRLEAAKDSEPYSRSNSDWE